MHISTTLSFRWIDRDGKLIILARGCRAFVRGLIAVLLAIYLDLLGMSFMQIGLVLSLGVVGSAAMTFLTAIVWEKVGCKSLFIALSLIRVAAICTFAFSRRFPVIATIALLGNITGDGGGGTDPIHPLEHSLMPDTVVATKRTDLFAIYGIVAVAAGALGAFAAGLPEIIEKLGGVETLTSYRIVLVASTTMYLCSAFCYSLLSSRETNAAAGPRAWVNPFKLPSRRKIFTLTMLFSIDSFGGALILPSLAAYWFATRFGIDLGSLAMIFFVSRVLVACSLWLSAKIANRIGLINTMVFTHIPANLFVIGVVLSPVPWLAILFWQLRSFLATMDVPARESYTMAIVKPSERVAMGSTHYVGRSIASSLGPTTATALWNSFSAAIPFIGGALIKVAYDLGLYFLFRKVKAPEERE